MFLSLDEEFGGKSPEPEPYETIWWSFWEKGISLEEFNKLPLPYIFSIISTQNYVNQKQEEAHKKAQRK